MNWDRDRDQALSHHDKNTEGWAETDALPTKLYSNAHIEVETEPDVEK